MNVTDYVLDIIKSAIAGLIVVCVAFYLARSYFEKIKMMEILQSKKTSQAHTLPLRLQAYERLILFIERINPANMLLRIHSPEIGASEMHQMIISEIRTEFQHNIAQQLYTTHQSWLLIKRLKDDTITLINNVAKGLPEHASALELNKAVLMHLSNLDENPYDSALVIIKQDIHQLF